MLWLIYAILTYFIWSITTLGDKYLLTNKICNVYLNLILFGGIGITGFFALPFASFTYDHWIYLVIALLSGVLFIAGHYPYYRLLGRSEASRIVVVWSTIPLFVLLLSRFFLDEILSPVYYLAFTLLVIGGCCINLDRSFKVTEAFWHMLLSSGIFALSYFLQDLAYAHIDFWFCYALIMFGFLVGIIPLLFNASVRKELSLFLATKNIPLKLFVLGKNSLSLIAFILINKAFALGSVSMVNALEGTYPVFVFIETVLLSYFFPTIIKEDISFNILLQKIICIGLVVVGIVLIAFY